MTTTLSKHGEITLPASIRKELGLVAGDCFEVSVEDEGVVLKKSSRSPNQGLVQLLSSCPYPFEIPDRENDDTSPKPPESSA